MNNMAQTTGAEADCCPKDSKIPTVSKMGTFGYKS